MDNHFFAVIMAGGGGTRLWPLSRQARPKQMVSLNGGPTLFELAVERLAGVFPVERILVVTVADQARALQSLCPEIPVENYLIEPLPRSTASVVAYAALALYQRDPDATMAVVTADHMIQNVRLFHNLLEAGFDVAQDGWLVTIGIKPTHPSTGYGYIQTGAELGQERGLGYAQVQAFKEKPDLETARRFLEAGTYFWNSGMFVWTVRQIQAEFRRSMPVLDAAIGRIGQFWNTPQREAVILEEWQALKPVAIDYGIMEKAGRIAVLPAQDLGWSDVGSWDSLFEIFPADQKNNIILSRNHFGLDTNSTLVYSQSPERLVVTIGTEDLIIIDTGDALLVCKRSEVQQVRQVVSALRENQQINYL